MIVHFFRKVQNSQCSSPPSEIVLDPTGELSTRFHGHFSDFATKSFTAEADLQANTQNKQHKTLDK